MIDYVKGDMFESKCQVITNPINTVGVMGGGLARDFKERFPNCFQVYKEALLNGNLSVGRPILDTTSSPWILLFPTKQDWRFDSKLEYIDWGLQYFVDNYEKWGIESIAFPMLGCGLGNLENKYVLELFVDYLANLPIQVEIYR